ncbi:hypothetical protein CsSME_00046528 [Camellia sinensis var. sinensis]
MKFLAPLLNKFKSTIGKKAYIVVSGGQFFSYEDAIAALNWPKVVCKERRFKIFDLGIGRALSGMSNSQVSVVQGVYASVKGLMRAHSPSVVLAVSNIDSDVMKALEMVSESSENGSKLVLLPRASVSKVLWMANL